MADAKSRRASLKRKQHQRGGNGWICIALLVVAIVFPCYFLLLCFRRTEGVQRCVVESDLTIYQPGLAHFGWAESGSSLRSLGWVEPQFSQEAYGNWAQFQAHWGGVTPLWWSCWQSADALHETGFLDLFLWDTCSSVFKTNYMCIECFLLRNWRRCVGSCGDRGEAGL